MRKITLATMLLFWGIAQSQLFLDTTTMTPAELVQNVLIGQGVTPFNLKYNGSAANAVIVSDQLAHFQTQATPTGLGINQGLLMSTHKAVIAQGPNNVGGGFTLTTDTPIVGDADLQDIAADNVTNICILEFDFIATGLELNFDYVFASEEYPEWVSAGYNDVFGFFLSGPGISGPYSGNAKNIALLPSTSIPISIDNVNAGSNSGFYVSNISSNPAYPYIQYDGFTTVLRAISPLECGGLYHIKLAISNVGDDGFASAVFLKNFRIAPMEILDDFGQNVNFSACFEQKLTLSTTMPPGTYLYSWKKDGIAIPGASSPTLSVTEAGTYTVTITTPAGCVLATDDFVLGYQPAVPIAVSPPVDINLCPAPPAGPYTFPDIGQTSYILNGYDPDLYTISYYDSTFNDIDGLTGIGELVPSDLVNYIAATLPKTIYVRVDDLVGTCYVIKSFELNANVAASPGVLPISYCQGEASIALTATGTNLLWYNSLTGGSGNASAPTPSTSTTGNTTYYVTQTVGACESVRTPLVVSITSLPSAPVVTSPVVFCLNEASAPLSAAGSNLLWYSAATGGTGSAIAPIPNTAVASNTTYYVSQSTGCESSRSAIVVNVTGAISPPNVTTPVTYCQGNSSFPLTATGSNLKWYIAPVGGSGNLIAPVPNTSVAGSTTYFVSQTIGACESPRTAITVDITAPPAAPIVSPITYCQNDFAAPVTATGNTLLWYSAAIGGTGSPTPPTPLTASGSITNYYVSQTVNGCEGSRAVLTVTVTATPAAPAAVSPISYCQGDAATPLSAAGTNLLWYNTASGGLGSALAPTPNTAGSGSQIYYVSQNNGCESPRTAISVNVSGIPAAPIVLSPLNYCEGNSAALLTATGTNLLWYSAATGGTGNATAPVPSTASAGSTMYYVSQSNGICESARSAITVNVLGRPSAPVTAPVAYCQNATASALTATGSNLQWYNAPTGGTSSTIPPTPSTSSAGTTNFYVSQTVAGCESLRSLLSVTISAPPPAPVVMSPIIYCQGSIATALNSAGSNLLWYSNSSGGTGSSTAPVPVTASSGSTTYYVSQSNGCESARSPLVVNVVSIPAAPAVITPLTYCQGESTTALSAIGSNLIWYASAIGGIGSPVFPNPSTAIAGSTVYYVTQNNGTCESPRAAITVDVLPRPSPPVTSPVSYCINNVASLLTASGVNLLWYNTPSGGAGSSVAPMPLTNTAGITNYYVSQTVAGCESLRALLAVTITAPPAAPLVNSPVSYCQGTPGPPLTASGTNLLWYTSATGGIGSLTAPSPSTSSIGNTSYYVSQSNGCEGPRSAIVVNVIISLPAPVVATPVTYCQGAVTYVLGATGSNLRWYTSATGGTGSAIAPTPLTVSAGNTIFYVSQSTGACESPRAAITVSVLNLPASPLTAALNYCKNAFASQLTAIGSNLLWYTSATGGNGNAAAPIPATANAGTTTYYVSQTINGCEGPRAGLTVTVNAPPAAPTVQSPVFYCEDEPSMTLSAIGTNLKWYTSPSGGTGSNIPPTPNTASGGSTTYYVSQNNGCEGPRAPIVVSVTSTPSAPSVASPINYCEGEIATALTAVGTNLMWYASATGGTGNISAPVPDLSIIGNKTYYVSQRTGNCESPRAAIVVQVNSIPEPKLQQDGIICFNSVTNTANSPFILDAGLAGSQYQFEWFISSGGSWNPIAGETQQTYNVETPGTYGVKATINGICPSGIVSATVGMSSPPLEIKLITSNYFEDDQMITVNVYPAGTYLYQMDNGAFQSGNVFMNLPTGTHHITVKNDCGELGPMDAVLISYPKYFTPNGDGYNDTWNIFSLRSQPNAKIYIFDRYGKFLKEISPNGIGWDGFFNQQILPATDYWFQVYYEENSASKVFKSHFALKR